MQRESSTILNKVLLSILVSRELAGKVVQGRCWVLSGAEPSGWSQKGELQISAVMVILFAKCDKCLAASPQRAQGPLTDRGWQVCPGFPTPEGISMDTACPYQISKQFCHTSSKEQVLCPQVSAASSDSTRAAQQLCQQHSQEFLQATLREQQSLPVFKDHRIASFPRK